MQDNNSILGDKNGSKKKLLVLNSNISSKEIIKYAKSIGVHTIVADRKDVNPLSAKRFADEAWKIDLLDLDALEKKCREADVDGIICGVSEFTLDILSPLCARLNKPCYFTPEAMHYSRDKADFKKAWREKGVPLADDYFITPELRDDELEGIKFPVVVKPVDCCANTGISFCYNKEELKKGYKYALSVSNSTKIVVERMLKGKEWYAFYAMADGECSLLALNAMYSQPGYPTNCYTITTTVSDNVDRFIREANTPIIEALKGIGCREGIAWVQLMLDEDNHFYVLEMGYRGDSEMLFLPYKELLGFDSVKLWVDYALGIKHEGNILPPSQSKAFTKTATSYMLWAKKDAVIKQIIGMDEIEKMEHVYVGQWKTIGDQVHQYTSMATICFSNDNIEDTCEMIDKINRIVKFIDETDEDIIIKYDQFDYLKGIYQAGLEGK